MLTAKLLGGWYGPSSSRMGDRVLTLTGVTHTPRRLVFSALWLKSAKCLPNAYYDGEVNQPSHLGSERAILCAPGQVI